ncbi:Arylsulfatase A [Pseudozobellia thermophila]|uniref:Arylsulfatase A n=2 Tax=Pseudozobellia thermophila TaxID=192903 RepID=A0A1M6KUF2_9FLAO|nr:Arylsulfatase A [Pseudozobellia thermophila]
MANYEPSMIGPDRLTIMQMLKNNGYATGGFGKWHLGATFPTLDGKKPAGYGKFKADNNGANIDLTKLISDGPVDYGFERWLGFSCASECWVLGNKEVIGFLEHDYYNVDSATNKEHLKQFPRERYLSFLTDRSTRFVEEHTEKNDGNPFFLYYAPYVPHIPLAVGDSFIGATDAGLYGDYVHELDFYIGKLLKKLDSLKLTDNTLVIFASDNGSTFTTTSRNADFSQVSNTLSEMKVKVADELVHRPNGVFRGTKQSIWEGGVRTPFIARWPGHIPQGAVSQQLFALNDVMATLAAILDYDLSAGEGVDSYNLLPVLKGNDKEVRPSVIVQSSRGRMGLRKGHWKYIAPDDQHTEGELYNLYADTLEMVNEYKAHPELVREMQEEMARIIREAKNGPSL